MYEIPSRRDVRKCVINGDTIRNKSKPILLTQTELVVDWPKEQTA